MDIDYPDHSLPNRDTAIATAATAPRRPLNPETWPFELFFNHFVPHVSTEELLKLRLVSSSMRDFATSRETWRTVAKELTKIRPIPVSVAASLAQLANSDTVAIRELIKSCVTATRVHLNWSVWPQPILRKLAVFQPGAQKRWVDIATLLTPGSRYLISTEFYEDEQKNKLTISDIQQQAILGSWPFPETSHVLTFRPVENGAAIMFVIQPSIIRPDGLVEYELVRFEFNPNRDVPIGKFHAHSIFRQPTQVTDISLSEDLILITDVEEDLTVSFEILDWRTGALGRLKTGITSPADPYNLNITGEKMALWVHHPTNPKIYNFPSALVEQCLRPDVDEVHCPPMEALTFKFVDTCLDYLDYELLQSWRARYWETTKYDRLTDRGMQVSQYFRKPSSETSLSEVRLAIAHHRLPLPFDGKPLQRTWLLETTVVMHNPLQGHAFPFIEFNTKHGIWVEPTPDGGRVVRSIDLPLEHEKLYPPSYFEARIKTFPVPSTFDLLNLQQFSLDEPSGVLGLTFSDGRMWLLYYDGYTDDQYNVDTETLRLMFPDHTGPFSLNRASASDSMMSL